MIHRRTLRAIALVLAVAAQWCGGSFAQSHKPGTIRPLAAVPFGPDPDVACLASALETGDPAKGPSTWLLKAPAGCVVPWHSHTAREEMLVVAGQVRAEMSDHPTTVLGPAGYAMMGGGMAHQFTCQAPEPCLMFVTFDGPYDIKWGR